MLEDAVRHEQTQYAAQRVGVGAAPAGKLGDRDGLVADRVGHPEVGDDVHASGGDPSGRERIDDLVRLRRGHGGAFRLSFEGMEPSPA